MLEKCLFGQCLAQNESTVALCSYFYYGGHSHPAGSARGWLAYRPSGFPQSHSKQDLIRLWLWGQERGGGPGRRPWSSRGCRKPLFVVPAAPESKASFILSFLPGDQPRRGPPRAERFPQEARLCPSHLRRLPGGGHG